MPTRRAFLRGAGGALAVAVGPGAVGTAVAADDPFEAQPTHVTLIHDEDMLEAYQPLLVTRELKIQPSWLYGWVAKSNDRDTDVACYWAWYESQVSSVPLSSHRFDREPIYVFVDDETGEIEDVVYDAYHYLAERTTTPDLYEDSAGDHPMFQIAPEWHFYTETSEEGSFVDLANMHDVYPGWFDNDWKVHFPAVLDPWRMRSRGDWWPDDVGSFSTEANLRRLWHTLGWFGADRSDIG